MGSISQLKTIFSKPGDLASLTDSIAWNITSDLDVICVVDTDATGATVKKLTTVCEAICNLTRQRGVVEASMIDYDMQPMTKVHGSILTVH